MSISINSINLKERTINFIGNVSEVDSKEIINKINDINADDDEWIRTMQLVAPEIKYTRDMLPPIRIVMSTYGGSVYDGFALYDIIKNSKTPVIVECSGKIMSMGIIIMLAAKKRISHKHTTFMIHAVSGAAFGQLKNLEDNVDEAKRLNDMLFDIISSKCKIKREDLTDIYEHKKDWFLTADDAKAYCLIDEII